MLILLVLISLVLILLVLILLVFFGGQVTLNNLGAATGLWGYVEVSQFAAGAGTIGVIFGAYFAETFRGAIMAIPRGQIEAGISCGMRRSLIFRHIIWPQMIRFALPGFTNNWLVQLAHSPLRLMIIQIWVSHQARRLHLFQRLRTSWPDVHNLEVL